MLQWGEKVCKRACSRCNFVETNKRIMSRLIKYTLILLVVALVIIGAIYVFLITRTSQESLTVDHANNLVAEMPIDGTPIFVTLRPGLRFKLDTGADYSTITEEDLHLLDSLGFKARKSFYPVLGRDGIGDVVYTTERYTVDLPAYCVTTRLDSVGNPVTSFDFSRRNTIKNVDFVPSQTGFSVLGIDFLEHFAVELHTDREVLALYDEPPHGYETCQQLEVSSDLTELIYPGHRYSIDMEVDHAPGRYFIDTGLQRAFVKRPDRDRLVAGHAMHQDTAVSLRGRFPAYVDTDGWLVIGAREGTAPTVFYYDNDEEDYSFNPFNILKIDVLLDFPRRRLMFKR